MMYKKSLSIACAAFLISFTGPVSHQLHAIEDTSDTNTHSISDKQASFSVSSEYDDGMDQENQQSTPANQEAAQDNLIATDQQQQQKFEETHYLANDGLGGQYYASTTDKDSCVTADGQPGQYFRTREMPDDGNNYSGYYSTSGIGTFCNLVESRTLTANNPGEPRKPSPAEMLQEIEDKFANTDIRPPILKQSYNSGSGTGRAKGDPNIYKGDNVNFYAEAPTAYWEGELSAGHVEIESYPVQMTVQYGNGDEGSFYTIGEPIYPKSGSKAQPTATSYAYQRSGNFHAKRSTPTQ